MVTEHESLASANLPSTRAVEGLGTGVTLVPATSADGVDEFVYISRDKQNATINSKPVPSRYQNEYLMYIFNDVLKQGNSDNRDKVYNNFELYANEEVFYINPIYWYCPVYKMGFYYIDSNGDQHDYTFFNRNEYFEKDNLSFEPSIMGTDSEPTGFDSNDQPIFPPGTKWYPLAYDSHITGSGDTGNKYKYIMNYGLVKGSASANGASGDSFSWSGKYSDGGKTDAKWYRSRSYKLSIPKGTVFGLYMENKGEGTNNADAVYYCLHKKTASNTWANTKEVDSGHLRSNTIGRYYSNPALTPQTLKNNNPNGSCGIFTLNNRTYFTFECGHNLTLNDYGFLITPRPLMINYDETSFRFMCEDLGSTFDSDFNDLVFDVSHKDGDTKARITVQAAGGTLPLELWYNGVQLYSNVHQQAFATVQPDDKPVNVNFQTLNDFMTDVLTKDKEFEVPEHFNFTEHAKLFTVKVNYGDGTANEIFIPGSLGRAPHAFLTNSKVLWSGERVPINTTYPGFNSWVRDRLNTNWYKERYESESSSTQDH